AASARQQRSVVLAAQGHGGEHVFFVAWNYDADQNLAVVGSIRGIEGAAARVKANLAAKVAAKRGFKRGIVELHERGGWWSNMLVHKAQNIFRDVGVRRKRRLSVGPWISLT